jgi:hypothetical protein
MRQVTRNGLITVAAAGGVLVALSGGTAYADSGTHGSGSGSGILSGNNVQAPIDVPVNVCGNTVSVVGDLNSALGNSCGKGGSDSDGGSQSPGTEGSGHGKGVASGNNVQAPIDVPVNVCGNSVSVISTDSSSTGNACGDGSVDTPPDSPDEPEEPEEPGNPDEPDEPDEPGNPGTPGKPPADEGSDGSEDTHVQAQSKPDSGELAHTGADLVGLAAPLGAGLLTGGYVLYRRVGVARR